ncbi:CPS-53 (KpLE1) prophage protein [Escherichia coli]|nr:CPS-53 (KpLE1) prophage protein [Escherichia coli]
MTCAQWLWKKIIALYEQAAECDGEVVRPKEPNWTAWANEIRLMCVQDGRTHKQICEMYSRVSRDPFWCRNVLSPSKLREKWDELSLRLSPSVSTYTEKREDPYFKASYDNVDYSQIPARIQGVSMSLLNDVQKFIEAHPGCTSGDIADAFAGYSRQRVLQSASKLRQSGRVAHRCEGDTHRHFPRLTERAQDPEPQPVRETRPVRNFYVGTNDPRVILCLTRQAEELESRGLYRRAATVWMAAFRESHSQPERNNFLARRERCLRKSSKRAASGEEWYLSGNYVGA